VIQHIVSAPQKEKHRLALTKLQNLANDLARHMDAPANMPIHIHLNGDETPNAMAILGGHIIITQGLLNSLSSENGLSMVIAHELAHIKNRDALITLGARFALSLMSAMIAGQNSNLLVNSAGTLTRLSFSRKQENTADAVALATMRSYYGHTYGADEFFQIIINSEKETFAQFLRTHPPTQDRIALIQKSQSWTVQPALTPLPREIVDIQDKTKSRKNNQDDIDTKTDSLS
jgi:Zn-dependent protease with chaperone function